MKRKTHPAQTVATMIARAAVQPDARDIGGAVIGTQPSLTKADSHTRHHTWVTARPESSNRGNGNWFPPALHIPLHGTRQGRR